MLEFRCTLLEFKLPKEAKNGPRLSRSLGGTRAGSLRFKLSRMGILWHTLAISTPREAWVALPRCT